MLAAPDGAADGETATETATVEASTLDAVTVEAAAERVIEPTAVFVNPVSVTIGADGSPAFMSEDSAKSG
jgi:hypothetical protein